MRAHLLLFSSILLPVFTPSHAQAQSLPEMVATVVEYHPQIEVLEQAERVAEKDISEQHSAYYPTLSVNATAGRMYADNSTSRGLSVTRGAGYSNLWDGTASLSQTLYDGNERSSRVDASEARQKVAALQIVDKRENMALKATRTYVNYIRAKTGYAMALAHQNKMNEYIDRITVLVDEGAAAETDLQQALDLSILTTNFEIDFKGQLMAAEAEFMELTGNTPDKDVKLPESVSALIPETGDVAIRVAENANAIIRGAQKNSQAARSDIDAERSGYFPDVKAELSYMKSEKDDLIGGEAVDARAVVKMNWSFETGGAQKARVQKKHLAHQQSLTQIREAEKRVAASVRLAYAEKETAARQLKNKAKRVELNEKLFSIYEDQFEGAVVTLLQLMQAENQLFSARLEHMNAKHRQLLSEYSILGTMGQLQKTLGLDLEVVPLSPEEMEQQASIEQQ